MTVNSIDAKLSQDDNINEMFYRVSRSNAFVLLGDFNFPDIFWSMWKITSGCRY